MVARANRAGVLKERYSQVALVIAGFIGYACWEIFKLMVRFPQIKDAIIHIEPPPRQACGLVS